MQTHESVAGVKTWSRETNVLTDWLWNVYRGGIKGTLFHCKAQQNHREMNGRDLDFDTIYIYIHRVSQNVRVTKSKPVNLGLSCIICIEINAYRFRHPPKHTSILISLWGPSSDVIIVNTTNLIHLNLSLNLTSEMKRLFNFVLIFVFKRKKKTISILPDPTILMRTCL